MILDDGGDATLLVHKGSEYERAGAVPDPAGADSEEFRVILTALQRSLNEDPRRWTKIGQGIKGVTEETTTGVHRLYQMQETGELLFPAINGNIGHFDNEIDMAGLESASGVEKINIKPQVDKWVFDDGHAVIVLSEGRLMNLGNATGHPSFVMSNSFSNQTIAQIELFGKNEEYETRVYVLPKHLDEKVARLHLDALGARLTELRPEQAAYLGVKVDGPYKPDHYRY